MIESPSLICFSPPSLINSECKRIGSIAGSIASSTSQMSTGRPFLTAPMISLNNVGGPNFLICKFSFLSMFFIHLLAYSCGSIHRPHLSAFIVKIPFWSEVLSDGSPCMFQDFMTIGSPITFNKSKVSELGIFLSFASALHASVNYFLYEPEKPPQQEIQAQERKTSPMRFSISTVSTSTVFFQRTPSSARRTTSFSARAILSLDYFKFFSRASFSSTSF